MAFRPQQPVYRPQVTGFDNTAATQSLLRVLSEARMYAEQRRSRQRNAQVQVFGLLSQGRAEEAEALAKTHGLNFEARPGQPSGPAPRASRPELEMSVAGPAGTGSPAAGAQPQPQAPPQAQPQAQRGSDPLQGVVEASKRVERGPRMLGGRGPAQALAAAGLAASVGTGQAQAPPPRPDAMLQLVQARQGVDRMRREVQPTYRVGGVDFNPLVYRAQRKAQIENRYLPIAGLFTGDHRAMVEGMVREAAEGGDDTILQGLDAVKALGMSADSRAEALRLLEAMAKQRDRDRKADRADQREARLSYSSGQRDARNSFGRQGHEGYVTALKRARDSQAKLSSGNTLENILAVYDLALMNNERVTDADYRVAMAITGLSDSIAQRGSREANALMRELQGALERRDSDAAQWLARKLRPHVKDTVDEGFFTPPKREQMLSGVGGIIDDLQRRAESARRFAQEDIADAALQSEDYARGKRIYYRGVFAGAGLEHPFDERTDVRTEGAAGGAGGARDWKESAKKHTRAQRHDVLRVLKEEAGEHYLAILRFLTEPSGSKGVAENSSLDSTAVSGSQKGVGVMQLNPDFNETRGLSGDDLFDLRKNIRAGVRVWEEAWSKSGGDPDLAADIYRMGANNKSLRARIDAASDADEDSEQDSEQDEMDVEEFRGIPGVEIVEGAEEDSEERPDE